jgi:hypothetical protein
MNTEQCKNYLENTVGNLAGDLQQMCYQEKLLQIRSLMMKGCGDNKTPKQVGLCFI